MRLQLLFAVIVLLVGYYQICSQKHTKKSISAERNLLKDRIIFAIDSHEEIFTNMELKLTNDLFDIHIIRSFADFTNATDFIAHTDWNNLIMMYKMSAINTNSFLPNTKKDIEIFSNNVQWYEWMNEIGLGNSVLHTYSVSGNLKNLKYPLVLRTNRNFGRGSFIIANKYELSLKISALLAKDKSFMLEESLTGLGQREMTVYGGVYKGRLLSMRCLMREFAATTTTTSTSSTRTSSSSGNTTISNQNTKTTPYVRGFHLKHLHEHWLPCGRDLIAVHKKMFAATSYSGSWCSEVKLDSEMRPKIFEVNARFCGSLAGNDALFVLSFVPIAFAMLEADPSARIAHALQGPHNGTYRHILVQEQRALETGGGFYQRHWVTVDRFNPFLWLDPIDQYLTRWAIRAHSKIVVSVKDPDLLFRLTHLKATSTLFEFHNASAPSSYFSTLSHSIDLVLPELASTRPGNLSSGIENRNAWVSAVQNLGYDTYVPKQYSRDAYNVTTTFPVTLRTWLREHNSSTNYAIINSGNLYATASATTAVLVSTRTVLAGLLETVSDTPGVEYAVEEVLTGIWKSRIKVFGSAHGGSLLSMRCVLYTTHEDSRTATAAPTKQLVACGRDLVSVLTGYFAQSGAFSGVFCATIEMDSSSQPKFTELETGLCEELTVSDAGFIGAYVPLAAALFTDRHQTHRSSVSTPIELNWLENRNIYRHIVAVEKRVLAGGGGVGLDSHQQKVDKFHPPGVFLHALDGFPASSLVY